SNAQSSGPSTVQFAAPMGQSLATTNQSAAPNLQLTALDDTVPIMQHPSTSNVQHVPPTRQFAAPTTVVGQSQPTIIQSSAPNLQPPASNVVALAMTPPTLGRTSLRNSNLGTNLPVPTNTHFPPQSQPTNLQPVPPPNPTNLPVSASDQPIDLLPATPSQVTAIWNVDDYHSLRLEARGDDEIADIRNFNQRALDSIFSSSNEHNAIDASIGRDHSLGVAWTFKNLQIFIEEWARFVKADTRSSSHRTRTLTVNLPTTPITENIHDEFALKNSIQTLDLLPMDLEVLSWTGHRKQLSLFLGQGRPFKQLERLTLRCRISLHEFKFLLSRGQETLRVVDICTLIDSDPSSHDQGDVVEGAELCAMKSLKFLALESEVPFRLLCDTINSFTFPTLREMDIMSEGDFTQSFFTDFTGDNLRKFKIHCAMSEEDQKWLRDHKDSLRLDKLTIDASTPKRRVL
ncbi:hypothetical protein H0H93_006295, partial [Arthromyces matolae]